jgi:phasin family protein
MTSLSDHLSTVRQSQWEAQLDVFRTLTNRALDSANQLIALNLRTSRASVEQATGTIQQMLHATDPRDLVAIGSQAQGQWQQLFSYSRELLGIAAGVRQAALASVPAPQLAAPAPPPVQLVPAPAVHVFEQAAIAAADSNTVTGEIAAAAAAADTGAALAEATLDAAQSLAKAAGYTAAPPAPAAPQAEPAKEAAPAPAPAAAAAPAERQASEETQANIDALADTVIAEEVPAAKAKPLAKALSEVAAKPVSAEHPIASTVPLESSGHIELPKLTPSESTPPVHLSTGPSREAKPARASRKK